MASGNALDFDRLRSIGDEEPDALVLGFIASSNEPAQQAFVLDALLERLMRWTPQAKEPMAPAAVETFLREKSVLPPWFDPQRVANAQDLFDRFRMTALLVLGCASLPHCYAHGEIANTLTVSGMLGMRVRQRIQDTADFVSTVMRPGSLADGSAIPWIRKVRLMHAVMRRLTLLRPDTPPPPRSSSLGAFLLQRNWDTKDGMPLDQVELAYVLLTFSHVVLEGWKSLRILPRAQQSRDYLFTWALIGSMLGVREELLAPLRAGAVADAAGLFAQIKAVERETPLGRDPFAKEKGRLLTATLNVLLVDSVLRARLPALVGWARAWFEPVLRSLPRTLVRRLIGVRTAGELWVDKASFLHWLVHTVIIEFVGFRDLAATAIGIKVRETGMWMDVSDRFHAEVRERLGRRAA
jgi:hypothetical protein